MVGGDGDGVVVVVGELLSSSPVAVTAAATGLENPTCNSGTSKPPEGKTLRRSASFNGTA